MGGFVSRFGNLYLRANGFCFGFPFSFFFSSLLSIAIMTNRVISCEILVEVFGEGYSFSKVTHNKSNRGKIKSSEYQIDHLVPVHHCAMAPFFSIMLFTQSTNKEKSHV